MRLKVVFVLLFLPVMIFAQWSNLKFFKPGAYLPPGSKPVDVLPAAVKKIIDEDSYMQRMYEPVAFVKISPQQRDYFVLFFDPGPSDDPAFVFYTQNGKEVAYLEADTIYIPGNGNVYTYQRTNTYFPFNRKYRLKKDTLEEVPQPYYYVCFDTKTKQTITIYQDKDCTKPLAVIPAGRPVRIVGQNGDLMNYRLLIRSTFGLVGWWKPKGFEITPWTVFEGVWYMGD